MLRSRFSNSDRASFLLLTFNWIPFGLIPPDISVMLDDRDVARKLYQQRAIPEFWLIDLEKEIVEQPVLVDGKYQSTESDASQSSILPSILPNDAVKTQRPFEFDF